MSQQAGTAAVTAGREMISRAQGLLEQRIEQTQALLQAATDGQTARLQSANAQIRQLEADNQQLRSELQKFTALSADLRQLNAGLDRKNATLESRAASLEQQLEEAAKANTSVRASIPAAILAVSDTEKQRLNEKVDQIAQLAAGEVGKAVSALTGGLFWRWNGKRNRQASLLIDSQILDPDWYIQRYPDVAESGLDPATHYMMIGSREGRLPNPGFLLSGAAR